MEGEELFPVKPARVLEVVADAYGLTADDLYGANQKRPNPEARRLAYRLLYEESRLSWGTIAAMLGRSPGKGGGEVGRAGRMADPAALEVLRSRVRLNGKQGSLW